MVSSEGGSEQQALHCAPESLWIETWASVQREHVVLQRNGDHWVIAVSWFSSALKMSFVSLCKLDQS